MVEVVIAYNLFVFHSSATLSIGCTFRLDFLYQANLYTLLFSTCPMISSMLRTQVLELQLFPTTWTIMEIARSVHVFDHG